MHTLPSVSKPCIMVHEKNGRKIYIKRNSVGREKTGGKRNLPRLKERKTRNNGLKLCKDMFEDYMQCLF